MSDSAANVSELPYARVAPAAMVVPLATPVAPSALALVMALKMPALMVVAPL